MEVSKKTQEGVGYRVNASDIRPDPNKPGVLDGLITVYAERKNENAALGVYGGDAYPMVDETRDEADCWRGIVIADDGLGSGAFVHPSLEEFLKCADDDNAKLSVFLRALYGKEFFSDKKAVAYALRSFSPVPTDGFFVCDENEWKNGAQDGENAQTVLPFYKRDSQSLSSRIISVGVYYKFHTYTSAHKIKEWTEESAARLRDEIQNYVINELRERIFKIFDYSDAHSTDARRLYFLPCTLACWFYMYNPSSGQVSALALNVGDARCYLADLTEGVKQISIDDADETGIMNNLIHFGEKLIAGDGRRYGMLRARIIKTQAPCALFACSDGVYDTCPGKGLYKNEYAHGKYALKYGTAESSDFLFEKNFLEALRRCYSFEDVAREVVFNFYAQSEAQGFGEYKSDWRFEEIKRDDSGTLAMRVFGENESNAEQRNMYALFEQLRANRNTFIDRLYNLITEKAAHNIYIPYTLPHTQSSEAQNESKFEEYEVSADFTEFISLIRNYYDKAYDCMSAAGEEVMWGATHGAQKMAGFNLNQLFRKLFFRRAVLMCALQDWQDCCAGGGEPVIPAAWKNELHRHVIMDEDCLKKLISINFGKAYADLTAKVVDVAAERELSMYRWFEETFFGAPTEKTCKDVLLPDDRKRVIDINKLEAAIKTGEEPQPEEPAPKAEGAEESAKETAAEEACAKETNTEEAGGATDAKADETAASDGGNKQ